MQKEMFQGIVQEVKGRAIIPVQHGAVVKLVPAGDAWVEDGHAEWHADGAVAFFLFNPWPGLRPCIEDVLARLGVRKVSEKCCVCAGRGGGVVLAVIPVLQRLAVLAPLHSLLR